MQNRLVLVSTVGILLLAGCTTTQTTTTNGRLKVATSFYPLYYFASQIGGDYAAVTNLTPTGTEPHDYELTPQDIAAIQDSQLLVLNGGQLEPWVEDVTADLSSNTIIVEVVTGLTDPHVWLSPQRAKAEVEKITDGFIQADPSHVTDYTTNSQALLDRLDQLDTQYADGLANCDSNVIITSHAAFSYLASDYGLEQLSIAGLSPEAEPSLDELADITDFSKQNNVHYIFFESLVSPKLAETIANEIGAATLVLNPIEGLTDEEVAAGEDYVTVMQTNLINLQTALGCQ
ncbi:MAG: zinc ABC transporter substrate-binding protein [Candidatus Kerfeldbacteria bacterium]|nr:zinc ABC transporter substrate-binding protein [Candidatus Kerfeldbacteria bacterium]